MEEFIQSVWKKVRVRENIAFPYHMFHLGIYDLP